MKCLICTVAPATLGDVCIQCGEELIEDAAWTYNGGPERQWRARELANTRSDE